MAPIEKPDTGIPKLPLILGGFAALILVVTVLTRVVGPSSQEPPPPRPDPIALDAPAEANRPQPAASPSPSPPPVPVQVPVATAAPSALPPQPQSPPKRLFAEECPEVIVRNTYPLHGAYPASDWGSNRTRPTEVRRLTHAAKACQCIEGVYRRLGLTDLSGEDARSSYEDVLSRHGHLLRPPLYALFKDCELRAR